MSEEKLHESPEENEHDSLVTRRRFIKGSGAAAAAVGVASLGTTGHALAQDSTPMAMPMASPGATPATTEPGDSTGAIPMADAPIRFFTVEQAELVDALVSRIMPGDSDDPGAHEAGVVYYIDGQLAGANLGYDLKTYTDGPFPITEETPVTVEASSSRDIYATVLVASEDLPRYGYQSVMTPQDMYRRGLGYVDDYANSKFGDTFVHLTADQQDQIITDMAADKAASFQGPTGVAFFTQLRNDTIEGMFSDPMYGGNRNLVGWKLIKYPGAQRLYTPNDLINPTFSVAPQSLAEMMAAEMPN